MNNTTMLSMVKMLSFLIAVCLITTTTYYWVIKTVYYGDHKFVIHDYDLHAFQHSLIETEDRKNCSSKNVPNLIIQYGGPRTATTLQFQILCLIMAMLHENEINSVGCYFSKSTFVEMEYKYAVIKTHRLNDFIMNIPPDAWVFLTSSKSLIFSRQIKMEWCHQELIKRNITIPFIADVDLVSKRGYYIAYEYQCIFGLSDTQMGHILEYLRYWQILRKCCGVQMSFDWRNQLSPNTNYSQHYDLHSPIYPACEMYNITQVEDLMRKTQIFTKFSGVISLHHVIGKPSTADGELNGTYCERCQANITKNGIKFNTPCT